MNAAPLCCNAAFNGRLKLRLVDGEAALTNEAPSPIAMLTSSNVETIASAALRQRAARGDQINSLMRGHVSESP